MTFEEYWAEIEKLKLFPHIAIVQLPISLFRLYEETVDEEAA